MAVHNGERIDEAREGIQAEIRRAWENLEAARQTLEQASDLTAQYRRLLGSESTASQNQAGARSRTRDG
ncbi:hypothetical protein AYO47_05785 [Planctomyces sp. SCGC AG-212-M04]|nr:hypothetical protein AYO47_05785 [Planctomyces sp. SCGC AG-212-M04]